MISVLIPVYNSNVTELVQELHLQLLKSNIDFEILLRDDDSSNLAITEQNVRLAQKDFVQYTTNPTNAGSASSRIALAKDARFDWLLFLDSDVMPVHKDFIDRYIFHIKESNADVFAGNILYKNEISEDNFKLKLLHGKNREELPKKFSKNNPLSLRAANFMIKAAVFSSDFFLKLPNTYGYVDTAFAIRLQQKGLKLTVIDNPVYHLGIETAKQFLRKTELAVENAYYIRTHYPKIGKHIRLIKTFNRIKALKLVKPLSKLFKKNRNSLLINLLSSNPSLKAFQAYKLGYLCLVASENIDSNSAS